MPLEDFVIVHEYQAFINADIVVRVATASMRLVGVALVRKCVVSNCRKGVSYFCIFALTSILSVVLLYKDDTLQL